MIRNFKALGFAFAAVLAMGALNASSASAVDVFTAAKSPVLLTSVTHNSVLSLTGATEIKIECTTARLTATMENGSTEAVIDTEYAGKINETPHGVGCSSSLGNLTIDTGGCFTRSLGQTTGSDEGQTDATVWMECEAGKTVLITSSLGLTLSFPGQTPTSGGATFFNLPNHPGGAAIEARATFRGMTYTCTPTFLCGLAGVQTHGNNADITGTAIFTGYEDLDGLPTPVTEGARVPIEVS